MKERASAPCNEPSVASPARSRIAEPNVIKAWYTPSMRIRFVLYALRNPPGKSPHQGSR
jgi:hypothetical protein